MKTEDQLWRGMAGHFRILAVTATQTAQTARDLHDLSPVNALLLGKMLSAAAMLSLDLKSAGAEVTLRLDGDGPLAGALVICSSGGALRGYAFCPRLYLEEAAANLQPLSQLGTGTLSVIRSHPRQRPVSGYTSLVPGELAHNLAHYFEQSEQLPAAVNLGVLIDPQARIRAAGGFIIQQLPGARPEDAESLIARLGETPHVSDLMDMGLSIPEILNRFVFPGQDYELQTVRPIRYQCNCSREKFARALSLLDINELKEMRDGIDPVCHFCNTTHHFSAAEIEAMILAREAQS
ncbi:MAG TPA: Hsp33 family molecular chaperone HslO [Candidatus Syntrophosphaera sp.]|nr:Hsp33 family molecular chaperone HslO [Candidatus Syntrophosphaera sp.]